MLSSQRPVSSWLKPSPNLDTLLLQDAVAEGTTGLSITALRRSPGAPDPVPVEVDSHPPAVRCLKRLHLQRGLINVAEVLGRIITPRTVEQLEELVVDVDLRHYTYGVNRRTRQRTVRVNASTAQLSAYSHWPALQRVDLCSVAYEGLPANMPSLQSLKFCDMFKEDSPAASRLGRDLARFPSLCSLDLSGNYNLRTVGLIKLLEGVSHVGLPNLRVLNLLDCGLDNRTGQVLGAAASSFSQLEELCLTRFNGSGSVAALLADGRFPCLHTLTLEHITTGTLAAIVAASHTRAFRCLDLTYIEGTLEFPVFLQGRWPQLRVLRLCCCDIQSDLDLLAACPFPVLERLDLSSNWRLKAHSVLMLQGAFPRLTHIDVFDTDVTDDEKRQLAATFRTVDFC